MTAHDDFNCRQRYQLVRQRSLALAAPLSDEDCGAQSMADASPVKLSLAVAKARRLRLVVDFGLNQDTGDRVIWADARVYRSPAASTASSEAPKPASPAPDSTKSQPTKPGSGA